MLDILFLLTWQLDNLYTLFAKGSSWVQRRQSSSLWTMFSHQQVILALRSRSFQFHPLIFASCTVTRNGLKERRSFLIIIFFCRGNHVCSIWREEGRRWVSLRHLQRRKHIWAWVLDFNSYLSRWPISACSPVLFTFLISLRGLWRISWQMVLCTACI